MKCVIRSQGNSAETCRNRQCPRPFFEGRSWPGMDLGDGAARAVIAGAGYGDFFGHGTGHGVGLEVHERPSISPRSGEVLAPGMVFTVEPGIYLENFGGVRIEDMVLVTPSGCEIMSRSIRRAEI